MRHVVAVHVCHTGLQSSNNYFFLSCFALHLYRVRYPRQGIHCFFFCFVVICVPICSAMMATEDMVFATTTPAAAAASDDMKLFFTLLAFDAKKLLNDFAMGDMGDGGNIPRGVAPFLAALQCAAHTPHALRALDMAVDENATIPKPKETVSLATFAAFRATLAAYAGQTFAFLVTNPDVHKRWCVSHAFVQTVACAALAPASLDAWPGMFAAV